LRFSLIKNKRVGQSISGKPAKNPRAHFFEELDSPACDSQFELIDVMQNGGNSIGPEAAIYKECTSLCHRQPLVPNSAKTSIEEASKDDAFAGKRRQ
jgi:hypothetical protein